MTKQTKVKQMLVHVLHSERYGLKNVYDRAVNAKGNEVYIGQQGTEHLYSDRQPFTVLGVSKSGAKIIVQDDAYDPNTFHPSSGYADPVRDTEGRIRVLNYSPKYGGSYKEKDNTNLFLLGGWAYYRDPSF